MSPRGLWCVPGAALLVTLGSPAAVGQLSSSAGFQLDGYSLASAGGGSSSADFAALGELASYDGSAVLSSAGFQAEWGSLRLFDPWSVDQPALFAVLPPTGFQSGGTAITVHGAHFELGGAAAPLALTVGGVPVSGLAAQSDSILTATVPAGPSGPKEVLLTTSAGVARLSDGFIHTPAVRSSPDAFQTGGLRLENWGPVGAYYETFYSTATITLPLPPFGTLLIGPAPLEKLLLGFYPGPDGLAVADFTVPTAPAFAGLPLHFQSLAVLQFSPLDVRLTNRSTTVFH
jgi:hypothetical protein